MPHKAKRKLGRPSKATSGILTTPQQTYVQFILENRQLTGAAIARKLNVTRQAISKWQKDPVIQREVDSIETKRASAEIVARLEANAAAKVKPFQNEFNRILQHKKTHITVWVRDNWQGPFNLYEDGPFFNTQNEYVEFMLKENLVPYEFQENAKNTAKRQRK
jgi:predicted transcriptional regulator